MSAEHSAGDKRKSVEKRQERSVNHARNANLPNATQEYKSRRTCYFHSFQHFPSTIFFSTSSLSGHSTPDGLPFYQNHAICPLWRQIVADFFTKCVSPLLCFESLLLACWVNAQIDEIRTAPVNGPSSQALLVASKPPFHFFVSIQLFIIDSNIAVVKVIDF